MLSYRKQIFFLTFFLMTFIVLGLFITSMNMEKVTLRERHDLLALIPQNEGLWEVKFLGSSVLINPEAITADITKTFTEVIPERLHNFGLQANQYAGSGYSYLKETISSWTEQLILWKEQVIIRKE